VAQGIIVTSNPFESVPLSPMRRIIATRMAEATQTIPHFRLGLDIELDALLLLRKDLLQQNPGAKLSVNDLMIKACAVALVENVSVNVHWAGTQLQRFQSADVAVVVATDEGIVTPVVRQAERKTVWEIGREMSLYADKARRRALKMEEIVGGTFTISNLGMYGIDEFDAIINSPQCAIVAIGAAKLRHVVGRDGATRVATVLRATLSCDHRAIDGATGAKFLSTIKQSIEAPTHLHAGGTEM
jgi:pyruvate dehydrogenase E2 component (dihydrolipoamide acetyltransferase)